MKSIAEILEDIELSRNLKNGRISNAQIENAIVSHIIFKFDGANDDDSKTVIYLNHFDRVIFKDVAFENSKFYDIGFTNCEFINCTFNQLELTACSFYHCIGISAFKDCSFIDLSFIDSRKNYRDAINISYCNVVNSKFKSFSEHYKTNIKLTNSNCENTSFEKVGISDSQNNNLQNLSLSYSYFSSTFFVNNEFEKINIDNCNIKLDLNNSHIDLLENINFSNCEFHDDFSNVKKIKDCKFLNCNLSVRNESLKINNTEFNQSQIKNLIIDVGFNLKFEFCKFYGLLNGNYEATSFLHSELTKVKVTSSFDKVSFRNSILFPENFECLINQVDFTDVNLAKGNLIYNHLDHNSRLNKRGTQILYLNQVNIALPLLGKITYCKNNDRFYSDFPILLKKRTSKDVNVQSDIMKIITAGHHFEIFRKDDFIYGIDASKIRILIERLYSEQLQINESETKWSTPNNDFFDDKNLFSNEELLIYYNKIITAIDYLERS
jgi:uncharacterized protein YjbI with pentapeptide repeats